MAVEIPVVIDILGGIDEAIHNQVPKAMKSLQSALNENKIESKITIGNLDQANEELKELNNWYRELENADWKKVGSKLDLSPYINQAIMELKSLEDQLNEVQELRQLEGGGGDFSFAEEYKRLNEQVRSVSASLIALQTAQKQIDGTFSDSGFRGYIDSLTGANQELQRMREYYSELEDYSQKYASSINAIRDRIAGLNEQWNAMTKAERSSSQGAAVYDQFKKEKQELKEVAHTLDEILQKEQRRSDLAAQGAQKMRYENAILNSNVKTIKVLQEQERILSDRLNRAVVGSTKYKQIEEQLKSVQAELKKTTGQVNNTTSAIKAQSSAFQSLASYASTYFSAFGLIRFAKQIRDVTGELEYQRVALGHLLQDEEYGARLFERIKEAALESPFQIKDIVTYTKQLAAYRIEQENLFDTTKRLADISAGLGVDMNRLILAFGQVRAASVLRGQELRQFTESGIPLVELLADKMGELHNTTYRTADVFKLISERAVPFSAISEIFEDLTEKGGMFYKMQEEQAKTLKGRWEKLKDAFSVGLQAAGETQTFVWQNNLLLESLTAIAKNIRFLPKLIEAMGFAWAAYTIATIKSTRATKAARIAKIELTADELKEIAAKKLNTKQTNALTRAMIMQKAATNGITRAWWKLNAAMIANPIAAIISGVTGLIALFSLWRKKTDEQSSSFRDLTDAIEDVSKSEKQYERLNKQINAYERLASKTERTAKENVDLAKTLDVLREAFPGVTLAIDDTNNSLEKTIKDLKDINERNKLEGLQKAFRSRESAQRDADDLEKIISDQMKAQNEAWQRYEFFSGQYGKESKQARKAKEEYDKLGETLDENNKKYVQYLKYIEALDKYLNGGEVDKGLAVWQKTMKKMKDFTVDGKSYNLIGEGDIEGYDSLYKGLQKIDKIYQDATNSAKEMKAALSSVADEYKEDAEAEIRVEEGRRDAAKAILDTFGYISKIDQKKDTTSLAILKEELKNVQDIYKRYKEFLKYMTKSDAQKKIKEIYGGVTAIDFLSPETYKKRLNDLLTELRAFQGRVKVGAKKLSAEMANDLKAMLRGDEGFRSTAYKLEGENAYTIGYGFYKQLTDGRQVVEGMTMTMEEAEAELDRQVERTARTTSQLLEKYGNGLKLTERQFNVLANLAYQGPSALKRALQEANGDAEKLAEALENAAWPYVAKKHQAAVKNRDMRRALLFKLAGATSEEEAADIASTVANLEKIVQDVDWDELEEKITKQLKKISDDIKKSEAARDFYKNILDLTGDEEIAANMAVSVYGGIGKDFKERMQEELYRALTELEPENINNDLMSQIMGDIAVLDVDDITKNLDKLPPRVREVFEKALAENQKYNADWVKGLLKTYEKTKTYEERITAIRAREAQSRKEIQESATLSDSQKESLSNASREKEAKEIADVELEALKDTYEWTQAFKDMDRVSTQTIKNLIALLDEYIKKNASSATPEALKAVTQAREQAQEQLIVRNAYAKAAESVKKYVQARKKANELAKEGKKGSVEYAKALDEERDALEDWDKAVGAIGDSFNTLSSILNSVSDILNLDDLSDGQAVLEGLATGLGLVGTALVFINAMFTLLESNPVVLAISSVIAGVAALAAIFKNLRVAKQNREIERQQKLIEDLEYDYDRLGKAIEKTFGSDYIYNYNKQLENLQAKQAAYEAQAAAERAKAKNDKDYEKNYKEKTEEYLASARDVEDQITDMQSQLSEFFAGTDLTSAAKDFASSWIEAYKEFGSTTDAMKERFQDLIESMVTQSLGAKIMQSILQPLFDEIDALAASGGELTTGEIAKIANEAPMYIGQINDAMTNLMNQLGAAGYNLRQGVGGFTGISRDIAGASEESITGLAAGINTQNFYMSLISQNVAAILAAMTGETVEGATGAAVPDPYKEQVLTYMGSLPQMRDDMYAIRTLLERVIKPLGTTATHYVAIRM